MRLQSRNLILLFFIAISGLRAGDFRIVTWNLEWLGSTKHNPRSQEDFVALRNFESKIQGDLYAFQEVESKSHARKVFGNNFEIIVSQRKPGKKVQRVGFALRKSSGAKIVRIDTLKSIDLGKNLRWALALTLTKNKQTYTFINVHLKSGCFSYSLQKQTKACKDLNNQKPIFEKWLDTLAQKKNPLFILGDFNRNFTTEIHKRFHPNQSFWPDIDDSKPTESSNFFNPAEGLMNPCQKGKYPDFVDHIFWREKDLTYYKNQSFKVWTYAEEKKSLSDHCPLSVDLHLPLN